MRKISQIVILCSSILYLTGGSSAIAKQNLKPTKVVTIMGLIPPDFTLEFDVTFTATGDSKECTEKNEQRKYKQSFKGEDITFMHNSYRVTLPVELEPKSPCLYTLSSIGLKLFYIKMQTQMSDQNGPKGDPFNVSGLIDLLSNDDLNLSNYPNLTKYREIDSSALFFSVKIGVGESMGFNYEALHFIDEVGNDLGDHPVFTISGKQLVQNLLVLSFSFENTSR